MTTSNAPRFLCRLAAVVAGIGAAQVVLLTMVPVISEYCGLSIAAIGGIVALGTLCFMLAGPFWGEMSDRLGCKPVVMAGLAGALLAQGLFVALLVLMADGRVGHAAGVAWLSASRILYGLSAAGIYPACQAWAVQCSPAARRLATLSTLSAAANLGRVLGPLLALPALGLASLGFGALWPLAWLVILPLSAFVLVSTLPSVAVSRAPDDETLSLSFSLITLFAVALLGTAAIGQLQVMLGPVLTDFYGLEAVQASSAAAVLLLVVAVVSVLVQLGVVRQLQAPRLSLGLGALLMSAGAVLLWIGLGSLWALGSLSIFVAGVACLVPGYTALASEHSGERRRGRLFGLLTLAHTGGYTIGFALGGWSYSQFSEQPLVCLLAVVALLAATSCLALYVLGRKTHAARAAAEGA